MSPVLFSVLTVHVGAAVMGTVVSTYWRWFVAPLGVPEIGIVHAIGLVLLLRIVASHRPRGQSRDDTLADVARDFAWLCFAALVLLTFGWALSWGMP